MPCSRLGKLTCALDTEASGQAPGGVHPALVHIKQRLSRLTSLPTALLPSVCEALVLHCAGVQWPEQHLGQKCTLQELALYHAAHALSDASLFAATAAVVAVLQQAFLAGMPLPASQPNVVLAPTAVHGQFAVAALMPASHQPTMQAALVAHWTQLTRLAPSGAAAATAAEASAAALQLSEHAPLPAATASPMPAAVADWVAGGGLLRVHAAALLRPSEMLRGPEGLDVHISRSVDFGMHQLQPAVQSHDADSSAALAKGAIAVSAPGQLQQKQEAASASQAGLPLHGLLFRAVTITNKGARPVWLLNVCLVPEFECLSVVDDQHVCCTPAQLQLRLARPTGKEPGSGHVSNGSAGSTDTSGPRAVVIGPGQEHSVTVVLRTSSQAAQQQQDTGLLEQFVLLTVLQETSSESIPGASAQTSGGVVARVKNGGTYYMHIKTSALGRTPADGRMSAYGSTNENGSTTHDPSLLPTEEGKAPMRVLVLARRCSAALLDKQRAVSVKGLLSVEARPFVPQQLRTLFEQPPQQFYASPGGKLRAIWGKEGNGVVTPQRLGLHFLTPQELPGNGPACRAGALALRRAAHLAPKMVQVPAYVRCLLRLLMLEELAMERDISNSYALYNTKVRTAVFVTDDDSSNASRQYCVQEWPSQPGDARWQSDQPTRRYRGPSLGVLLSQFPKEARGMQGTKPVLAVLQVPGLPEQRPDLLPGDVAYVRPAAAPAVEYAGHILGTDGSNCLVLMPQEWWEHLARGSYGDATAKLAPTVHVRFTFDRTSMHRMADALLRLPKCERLLLPPEFLGGAERPAAEALASPDTAAAIQRTSSTMQLCGGTPLNPEQKLAVATRLHGGAGRLPYVLFGPPGTGKTITLVEAVCQVLLHHPRARILCCAPQNYSADLICSALAASSIQLGPGDMLRLNDARRSIAQAKQEALPFCVFNKALATFRLPTTIETAAARVIVCSCSTAGSLPEVMQGAPALFDFVFIDEAGQAVVPEALIPLTLAKPHSSVMLCGDPRQLSPVVRCPTAALHGLSASLLELLIGYHTARAGQLRAAAAAAYEAAGAAAALHGAEAAEAASTPTAAAATEAAMPGTAAAAAAQAAPASAPQQQRHQQQEAPTGRRPSPPILINTEYSMLVRNYRSHSRLLELPSRLFYGGELLASADPATVAAPAWHHLAPANGIANGTADGAADGVGVSGEEEAADGAVLPFNTLFFGVRGQQLREGDAPSYFNPIEAVTLVDLVQSLLDQPAADGRRPVTVDDVGVIGTYRKQVQKIRLLLRERGLGAVRVGTVDDYQGQEERVIFISTVLSKPESLPVALSAQALSAAAGGQQRPWVAEGGSDDGGVRPELHLGFWNNPKRFNVAITRAKALLVVVGSPLVLMKDTNWRELLRHAAARGAYRGAGLSLMQTLMRSGDDGAGMDFFDTAQLAADADAQASSVNEDGGAAAAELAAAVKQIAELAQLGMGDVDRLYPETLDEFYESCADELQWRVAL